MKSISIRRMLAVWGGIFAIFSLACATTGGQEEEVELYEPEFRSIDAEPGEKVGITLAIIAPQFTDDAEDYYDFIEDRDAVGMRMYKKLKSSFSDVLISKGFNTTGPFDSRSKMTYPQKKQVSFAVYPKFELNPRVKVADERMTTRTYSDERIKKCKIELRGEGNISLEAVETLSGQKLWYKNVEFDTPEKSIEAQGSDCNDSVAYWPTEIRNAWRKMHEDMYEKALKAFDKYVNVEEFKNIKKNAEEVRKKTTF